MRWTVHILDATVQEELDRLPKDMQARLARIVDPERFKMDRNQFDGANRPLG